jgi:hypothetical protein
MEITIEKQNVTTTRTALAETESARFEVEVTMVDNIVTVARASIAESEETTKPDGEPFTSWMLAGTIVYENGSTHTERLNLSQTAKYIPTFLEILERVRSESTTSN